MFDEVISRLSPETYSPTSFLHKIVHSYLISAYVRSIRTSHMLMCTQIHSFTHFIYLIHFPNASNFISFEMDDLQFSILPNHISINRALCLRMYNVPRSLWLFGEPKSCDCFVNNEIKTTHSLHSDACYIATWYIWYRATAKMIVIILFYSADGKT